ncbi:hypothetical protein EOD08_14825 [Mesorhizobium sp. M6A.T.Ca.TU.002.02.2.1]|nr:hypothetical protein EOD08_14825 [Mesorhizobium sp. M6A.T.Ca.TU.002.02.2.1]
MAYKKLAIKSLLVNSANDRHGELENETAAIAWLFTNHEQYMRNLARDLVGTGEMYEAPLVWPSGGKFIVFDGNRRVTCLKLLADPKRAPSVELQEYFAGLRPQWNGTFPADLVCQIETDRERIDDILFRRHTGTQGGVGRSPWTDRMTANFVERTGKGGGVNVADEIEKRLKDVGMLPRKKIPWSTVNRLLSSEGLRNRVGISASGGKFSFVHDESTVLPILRRIADDLSQRNVVLGDLWKTAGKKSYIDGLDADGVLPPQSDAALIGNEPDKRALKPKVYRPPVPKPDRRTTLIPHTVYPVVWQAHLQRHHAIWDELQFGLKLTQHPNAISVLFRVLFELSVENYVSRTGLSTVHQNDKLATKAVRVGEDLLSKGKIDAKYAGIINKLPQGDKLFSMDTLNRYVHSPDFAPSPSHLTALWNQSALLVVQCLNA